MSIENYSVAVKIGLVENVSRGLLGMAAQFARLDRQAAVFQRRLNALKSQVVAGGMMIGAGAAMAAPFVYATLQAGKLQQQLRAVQLATHATNDEMLHFRQTVDQVATSSIFKSVDIASMAKTLATANTFKPSQVESLLPAFASFATTQYLLKGTAIAKSTEQAIQLAEITGHFSPTSIQSTLNAFTKLSLLMPGSVDKVLSAFKYAEGTMKNVMGVSDDSTLLMVAMLQRMGIQGTRAGTQMLALISRTIPQVFGSGLWAGQSQQMLEKMNMLGPNGTPDVFTAGKFDPLKFFEKLGTYVTKEFQTHPEGVARSDIMKTLQMTFGTTGTRIASIVSTPAAIEQFKQLQEAFAKFPNLDVIASQMDDLLNKQLPQASSNITSLFASLGYTLLPTASGWLSTFNMQIKSLINYIDTHQTTVAIFEKAIIGLAGLTVIGGILIVVRAGLMGLLIPLQILGTTFGVLSTATGIALTPLVGLTTAIGLFAYGAYKAIQLLTSIDYKQLVNEFKYIGNAIAFTFTDMFTRIFNWVKSKLGLATSPSSTSKINMFDNPNEFNRQMALKYPNSPDGFGYRRDQARANIRINHALPHVGMAKAASQKVTQPIHVHLNVDGKKMASTVINHVYHAAMNVPNSSSGFDSSLSPMPTIANAIGLN